MAFAARYYFLVSLFDPPVILDTTVTPIPGSGSAPLQVVASMPSDAAKVTFIDSTGEFIGLYTGPIGNEKLKCILGGGTRDKIINIEKGDRISLRNMQTSSIIEGELCVEFEMYG